LRMAVLHSYRKFRDSSAKFERKHIALSLRSIVGI